MAAASTRLTPRARRLPPTVGGTTAHRRHSDAGTSRSVRHRRARFRRPLIPEQQPTRRSPPVPATEARGRSISSPRRRRPPVRTPATIDSRHPAAASGRERGRAAARSTCRSAMRGRSEQRDPPPPARPDDTRTPSRLQRAGVVQMVQREPGEDEEVNAALANDRFATAPRTNSRLVNRSRAAAPRRRPFGCVLPSHVQPRQDPAAAQPPQFGGDPQATPAAVRVAKGIRCASRG